MNSPTYFKRRAISGSRPFSTKSSPLFRLDIELTERCNLNCLHCYINRPKTDTQAIKKEMSTDIIKNIIKEAASLGCMIVRLTGGEPLLRDDFEEIYLFARKCGLRVTVFTNATLITQKLANLLAHIPPLEKVEVTLYGMKRESYEAVTRVPSSFQTAWRGVQLLRENKIPFSVSGIVLSPNIKEVKEFDTWTQSIPWMDHHPPSYSLVLNLHSRRKLKKNSLIKKLRLSPEEVLNILTRYPEKYAKDMKRFCVRFLSIYGDKLFSCGAGLRSGSIDAYGNLQLCLLLRHPDTVYSTGNGTLKKALEIFFPAVRSRRAYNPEYLRRCARCFLKAFCDQCPAMSWMEHGTLDTPVDYLCDMTHVQARYLGLLQNDEKAWEIKDWRRKIERLSSNVDSQILVQ